MFTLNKRTSQLLFLAGILTFCILPLGGCRLLNPEEDLPVYVQVLEPLVLIDEANNVWSPAGIKDVWAFQQADKIGVFEMPVTFPVLLNEGVDSLRLGGGIFETGLSGFRVEYPFWNDVNVALEGAQPLDTVVVRPRFRYFQRDSTLIYALEEGFEGASIIFQSNEISDQFTSIQPSSEDKFVGQLSGKVTFSPAKYIFEGSSPVISLPQTGFNDIYCEVSYRNDIPFTVMLVGLTRGSLIEVELPTSIVFSSPNEWRTVYIHLNDLARSLPDGAAFKLVIRASSFDANAGSGRSGFLFLDHIRLIHYR